MANIPKSVTARRVVNLQIKNRQVRSRGRQTHSQRQSRKAKSDGPDSSDDSDGSLCTAGQKLIIITNNLNGDFLASRLADMVAGLINTVVERQINNN